MYFGAGQLNPKSTLARKQNLMSIEKLLRRAWLNRSAVASVGLAAGMPTHTASAAEMEAGSPAQTTSPTTLLFFDDQRLGRKRG